MHRVKVYLIVLAGLFSILLVSGPPQVGQAANQAETKGNAKHRILDPVGIERLKSSTGGRSIVTVSEATGGARFIRFIPGTTGDLMRSNKGASVHENSSAFFREYGSIFGIKDVSSELKLTKEKSDAQGGKHLSYLQYYSGVPVFAGILKTHFNQRGELTAVNGNFVPEINLDPKPTRSSAEAAANAVKMIKEEYRSSEGISSKSPLLYIYRTGIPQGIDGENHLVWQVEVGNGKDVREFVYIDAHSGKLVDRLPGIIDGLNRRAYDGAFLPNVPPSYPASPVWVEGDPFPTGNAEEDNMLLASQETYNFYNTAFGRDSFDGLGATLDSIFNRGYSCPNASWNGTFISFCNGLTTDDVTGHEWSHAYTEYTHNLIYAWQPGALNESYSDIFGETIDTINGRGTDSPNPQRTGGLCSSFEIFPPIVRVTDPGNIAGDYASGTSAFSPVIVDPGLSGQVIRANDGFVDGPTGNTATDGCGAGPSFLMAPNSWANAVDVAGKIVLIDRGLCGFAVKALNAQRNGAIGVIIANVSTSGNPTIPPNMGGATGAEAVTIPTTSLNFANGELLRNELAVPNVVNATLKPNTPTTAENSVRWMLGEDDTATGLFGPLRDMWTPTCFNNPGKVSDTQYSCSSADSGGVHNNSGVPNHAFALVVDGGTYNGQNILGIGLTKAAHIYFRAESMYQHSASDFSDHADSIEQSATDLIGVDLPDLSTGAPSGQIISAGDVNEVHKAMLAVEMKNTPNCVFTPLLGKNPPADPVCGPQTVKLGLFSENFETDISNWSISHDAVSGTFTPRDWILSDTLPDRTGKGFFAPDPNSGNCTSVNQSGVLHLTLRNLLLPTISSGPFVTFEHWVSMEPGFDGGQLMLSKNGGAFSVVPQANFVYNAHNLVLSAAATSSNPRAGQRAWSGTDGGTVQGSWSRTIVNLGGLVSSGDTIQLRWDLSTDCASGRLGWYLDDVNGYDCEPDADSDGVRDADDLCPNSDQISNPIVIIGTGKFSNTGVPNIVLSTGCTLQQKINECLANNPNNKGGFVDCVSDLTDQWFASGIITQAQKDSIMRAAGQIKK